jgi:hypothetical protein
MTVQASLLGKGYKGPITITVAPGASDTYTLTFNPLSIGEHKGSLELSIPLTGEKNTYVLVGKASEPLAEGHIIIDCQARQVGQQRCIVHPC